TGLGQREARECFQCSPETVSMYVNLLLLCTFSAYIDFFYRRYVKLPKDTHTPPEIRNNPRLYPFFRRVQGAIDCTHL
ncbi:hypothetical protein K466DRAFT_461768, partial [Polyporus arcularius HHB13444]